MNIELVAEGIRILLDEGGSSSAVVVPMWVALKLVDILKLDREPIRRAYLEYLQKLIEAEEVKKRACEKAQEDIRKLIAHIGQAQEIP